MAVFLLVLVIFQAGEKSDVACHFGNDIKIEAERSAHEQRFLVKSRAEGIVYVVIEKRFLSDAVCIVPAAAYYVAHLAVDVIGLVAEGGYCRQTVFFVKICTGYSRPYIKNVVYHAYKPVGILVIRGAVSVQVGTVALHDLCEGIDRPFAGINKGVWGVEL